jgi:ribosomal protein S18 acetylase RimI-like enzyme
MSRGNVIQGNFPGGFWRLASVQRAEARNAARNTTTRQPLPVQRHAAGAENSAFQVPSSLGNFASGGGQAIPPDVRKKMESFFGASFGEVRIHVGPHASAIGALAFTQGTDIHFAPGQYNPMTPQGQQILGHELAHVLQQRSGRVRNPFGSGVAVVQDHALEAEADRLGHRAAAHQAAQAKSDPFSIHRTAQMQTTRAMKVGNHSYQIAANAGGQKIGSVMVHAREGAAIEVTDLGVDPSHRKQGVGSALLESALRTGIELGKSKIVLSSQDAGSGHLTEWYKRMGFATAGRDERGLTKLEAPIGRVMAGVAQGKMKRRF